MRADILVVGAGLAGCSVARSALREDPSLEVVVVDSSDQVGSRLRCAEAVPTDFFDLVGVPRRSGLVNTRYEFMELHYASGHVTTVTGTEGASLVLNRPAFDLAHAAAAAEAGAKVLAGTRVTCLDVSAAGAVASTRSLRPGTGFVDVDAQVVIDASGTTRSAARHVIAHSPGVLKMSPCLEYTVCCPGADLSPVMELWWPPDHAMTYAWVFPLLGPSGRHSMANVGVAGVEPRSDTASALAAFLEERLPGSSVLRVVRGGVPTSGPVGVMHADRLLVTGDAAGLVHPMWGEGIKYAVCSGEVAGRVAAEAVAAGDCTARGPLGSFRSRVLSHEVHGRTIADSIGVRHGACREFVRLASDPRVPWEQADGALGLVV